MSTLGRRLSLTAAAEFLGMPRGGLYRLVRAGRIAFHRHTPATPVTARRGPGRPTNASDYFFFEQELRAYQESTRHDAIVTPARPANSPSLAPDLSSVMPKERWF